MKRIKLEFNQKIKYGSKEHFWHFMLGYLLPSIHFYFNKLTKLTEEGESNILLAFEDCGPLMNPLIEELTTLFNIHYEIINLQDDNQSNEYDEIVYLSRWDIRLHYSIYFTTNKNYNTNLSIRKMMHFMWFMKINISKFPFDPFGVKLKKEIVFTRNLILDKLNGIEKSSNSAYLLLNRSDEHSFYIETGKAESIGYGKSRRALLKLEEGCNDLIKKGIPVNIFQPGSYSLLHQIKTFNNSKGVIAIRGAELANLVWLKPGSKVVVIGFQTPAYHLYNYASLLDLKLNERSSDTNYPEIIDYNIKSLLEL